MGLPCSATPNPGGWGCRGRGVGGDAVQVCSGEGARSRVGAKGGGIVGDGEST